MDIWSIMRPIYVAEVVGFLLFALWRDSQGKSATIQLVFAVASLFIYTTLVTRRP